MNVLYCHDNFYMAAPDGTVYSAGQFPYAYFDPFLQAFGSVRVIARQLDFRADRNVAHWNVASGAGVSFRLLPNINCPSGLARHYRAVQDALQAELEMADAVIIRAVSDMGWMLYHMAKKAGKPVAMEMAACAWDSTWNHGSRYSRIYAPVRYWRHRIMACHADYVLYVSARFLPDRYPAGGAVAFVSNVRIGRPQGAILDQKIARIRQLYASEDTLVIGLIGTMQNRLKGVGDAIRAVARIENRVDRKIVLRILGAGNAAPFRRLEEQLGLTSRIVYDGLLPSGPAVLGWLDGVDIYIQPSYQEGLPRATIEAMSRACPVIGSTAGGLPELLPAHCLHRPGDIGRLAGLLTAMMDDPARQIDEAARNFDRSGAYAADILMPRRLDFWQDFAGFVRKKAQERLMRA